MKFTIAIEPGDDEHAFGVVVPDLPGCFSAGDTLEEACVNVREAIESHLAVLVDEGIPIPGHSPLAVHQANPDYAGWIWALVEIDMESSQNSEFKAR